MSDALRGALDRLTRLPGVRGAMIVDVAAGVPVVAELESDLDDTAVAALTASLSRRAGEAVSAARLEGVQALQLESDNGHLVAAGSEELLVVVVTEPDAQLGLVRLEARRVAEELK